MTEVLQREIITLSEVKKILESISLDEMDQIQRWTYDYSKKFASAKNCYKKPYTFNSRIFQATSKSKGRPIRSP